MIKHEELESLVGKQVLVYQISQTLWDISIVKEILNLKNKYILYLDVQQTSHKYLSDVGWEINRNFSNVAIITDPTLIQQFKLETL